MESAVTQAGAKEEDADFERVEVPISSSEVYMHGLMVHSFGTHHADAYGKPLGPMPWILRFQPLNSFVTSHDDAYSWLLGPRSLDFKTQVMHALVWHATRRTRTEILSTPSPRP